MAIDGKPVLWVGKVVGQRISEIGAHARRLGHGHASSMVIGAVCDGEAGCAEQ